MEEKLSERLISPDTAFSKENLKKEVNKKMLLKISHDIDKVSTREEVCNNLSNALSTICKILFFSATVLSFVSAYTDNSIYSIVSGTVNVIGNLCFQYSTSSQNESKSANIKLNQLLANIGVDPVPDANIPTDIENTIASKSMEELTQLLKTIKVASELKEQPHEETI